MLALAGKRAVVTGASRGIGFAIAERFLNDGASVVICDIVSERLKAAASQLSTRGSVRAVVADVSVADDCQRVVDESTAWQGGVDIVVNNAGIARFASFVDHSEEDWDRTLAVNLKAVFLLSQRAARHMIESGTGGVILSTASANGHVAEPGVAAYNAAKAGVVLLTKTMAIELARHGIRVNCVAPGHIGPTGLATDGGADAAFLDSLETANPMGRLGRLEEVASLFSFLASDQAPFITGESIVIDGGQLAVQFGCLLPRAN
jgi:3-oxoacyl-[acyl-carrier protein] reductase